MHSRPKNDRIHFVEMDDVTERGKLMALFSVQTREKFLMPMLQLWQYKEMQMKVIINFVVSKHHSDVECKIRNQPMCNSP